MKRAQGRAEEANQSLNLTERVVYQLNAFTREWIFVATRAVYNSQVHRAAG